MKVSEAIGDMAEGAERTIANLMDIWLHNMRLNTHTVSTDYMLYGESRDAHHVLEGLNRDTEYAIVCGSGPSLEKIAPLLKDWNGILICGPTNASICAAHGRYPDIIVVVDPNPLTSRALDLAPYEQNEVRLVASPEIHQLSLLRFPPHLRYYYKNLIWDNKGTFETPYSYFVDHFFNMIGCMMGQVGCVLNRSLDLLSLINRSPHTKNKVKRIFLAGADLSYGPPTQNDEGQYILNPDQTRCARYQLYNGGFHMLERQGTANRPGAFFTPYKTIIIDHGDKNLSLSYNGMVTETIMCRYKLLLYQRWIQNNAPYYNMSKMSILNAIPFRDAAEVINKQGKGIVRYSESYARSAVKRYFDLRIQKGEDALDNSKLPLGIEHTVDFTAIRKTLRTEREKAFETFDAPPEAAIEVLRKKREDLNDDEPLHLDTPAGTSVKPIEEPEVKK